MLLDTRHGLTLAVNLERAPAVSPYSHIYVPGAGHNNWQRAAHRARQAGYRVRVRVRMRARVRARLRLS